LISAVKLLIESSLNAAIIVSNQAVATPIYREAVNIEYGKVGKYGTGGSSLKGGVVQVAVSDA